MKLTDFHNYVRNFITELLKDENIIVDVQEERFDVFSGRSASYNLKISCAETFNAKGEDK